MFALAQVSICYMVATGSSAVTLPVVGTWVDKVGPRAIFSAAVVGLIGGCVAYVPQRKMLPWRVNLPPTQCTSF